MLILLHSHSCHCCWYSEHGHKKKTNKQNNYQTTVKFTILIQPFQNNSYIQYTHTHTPPHTNSVTQRVDCLFPLVFKGTQDSQKCTLRVLASSFCVYISLSLSLL